MLTPEGLYAVIAIQDRNASPHHCDVSSVSVSTVVSSAVMRQLDTEPVAVDLALAYAFQGDINTLDDCHWSHQRYIHTLDQLQSPPEGLSAVMQT